MRPAGIPLLCTTLLVGGVLGLPQLSVAQSHPHIGKWTLNTAKSVYSPGPPPRSQVRTYSAQGNRLKVVIETVQPMGAKTIVEYTAQFDGKDYPITGADAETIALTRIDALTFEAALKRRGKVVTTVRNTVAKDGKTMIVTTKGVNLRGQPVSSTAVFTKQ